MQIKPTGTLIYREEKVLLKKSNTVYPTGKSAGCFVLLSDVFFKEKEVILFCVGKRDECSQSGLPEMFSGPKAASHSQTPLSPYWRCEQKTYGCRQSNVAHEVRCDSTISELMLF